MKTSWFVSEDKVYAAGISDIFKGHIFLYETFEITKVLRKAFAVTSFISQLKSPRMIIFSHLTVNSLIIDEILSKKMIN